VTWQQLTLHIDAADLARVEALLELAGALSIALRDDSDSPILEPEPGTTPIWPQLTVHALFAADVDLRGISSVLGEIGGLQIELDRIDAAQIESAAQQVVHTIEIGPRLAIVPAADLAAGPASQLGLHMGLAFGTGQHPTTRLCLQWLEQQLCECGSVLDFGCGTAVLALAALRLGAAAATAVDIEPQALAAAKRNAALNGLSDRLLIMAPESLGAESYDLILANILAQPLIDLAEELATRQVEGGRIVLSGMLEAQLDAVKRHYERWYTGIETSTLDGWALVTGRRRNEYDH
jgi:ribosomal protein L11 methyltransferase